VDLIIWRLADLEDGPAPDAAAMVDVGEAAVTGEGEDDKW
jgi:hypothetical protein